MVSFTAWLWIPFRWNHFLNLYLHLRSFFLMLLRYLYLEVSQLSQTSYSKWSFKCFLSKLESHISNRYHHLAAQARNLPASYLTPTLIFFALHQTNYHIHFSKSFTSLYCSILLLSIVTATHHPWKAYHSFSLSFYSFLPPCNWSFIYTASRLTS